MLTTVLSELSTCQFETKKLIKIFVVVIKMSELKITLKNLH